MSKRLTSSQKLKNAIKKFKEYDKNSLKVTYSELVTLKHDFYKIDNYSLSNEELLEKRKYMKELNKMYKYFYGGY